jgi:hypothetical protein
MNYEIIEIEFIGVVQKHVIIDQGNGSFESFPMDDDNPRYQQWLAEGNTPEDVTTDEIS